MKKRILFVLFIILMGTYQNDVKATNERGFVTELAALRKVSPPEFTKKLEDVTAIVGNDVMLIAVVTGDPKPRLTYYKDEEDITSNERYQIKEDSGKIMIVIEKVQKKDEGVYSIEATNVAGTVKTSCYLKIVEE